MATNINSPNSINTVNSNYPLLKKYTKYNNSFRLSLYTIKNDPLIIYDGKLDFDNLPFLKRYLIFNGIEFEVYILDYIYINKDKIPDGFTEYLEKNKYRFEINHIHIKHDSPNKQIDNDSMEQKESKQELSESKPLCGLLIKLYRGNIRLAMKHNRINRNLKRITIKYKENNVELFIDCNFKLAYMSEEYIRYHWFNLDSFLEISGADRIVKKIFNCNKCKVKKTKKYKSSESPFKVNIFGPKWSGRIKLWS